MKTEFTWGGDPMKTTEQRLELLLDSYDRLVSETDVKTLFTRRDLELQFMVNRLRGKDTILSARPDENDTDNWYLCIMSV